MWWFGDWLNAINYTARSKTRSSIVSKHFLKLLYYSRDTLSSSLSSCFVIHLKLNWCILFKFHRFVKDKFNVRRYLKIIYSMSDVFLAFVPLKSHRECKMTVSTLQRMMHTIESFSLFRTCTISTLQSWEYSRSIRIPTLRASFHRS